MNNRTLILAYDFNQAKDHALKQKIPFNQWRYITEPETMRGYDPAKTEVHMLNGYLDGKNATKNRESEAIGVSRGYQFVSFK